jgi:hypothetical protein
MTLSPGRLLVVHKDRCGFSPTTSSTICLGGWLGAGGVEDAAESGALGSDDPSVLVRGPVPVGEGDRLRLSFRFWSDSENEEESRSTRLGLPAESCCCWSPLFPDEDLSPVPPVSGLPLPFSLGGNLLHRVMTEADSARSVSPML